MRRSIAISAVLMLLSGTAMATKRRAFVTSITGSGDISTWPGAAGSNQLNKADAVCRARALEAELPNSGAYRAWLSTDSTDAYCHIQGIDGKKPGCNGAPQPGGGPWYQTDGLSRFTGSLDQLTVEGAIYHPVSRNEFGDLLDEEDRFFTGTNADGTVTGEFHCAGWSSSDASPGSVIGSPHQTALTWTFNASAGCTGPYRLLCLEPGASEAPDFPWAPAALAFVTSSIGNGELHTWPHSGGFYGYLAGQAVCRQLALNGHLPSPNSFVAFLSDGDIAAEERITINGPFRRVDGISLANSKASLLDGFLGSSIHQSETGAYIKFAPIVWSGSTAGGFGTGFDCQDWTFGQAGEDGTIGLASVMDSSWSEAQLLNCSNSSRLYCISNVITLFWDGFELTGDSSRWSATFP